ncbi:hypothetical protein DXT77_07120 [Pseudomonas sp. 91RF]|nr:hypothetical protein DXT77_07120 [Pseudomonas sp. 91RF]
MGQGTRGKRRVPFIERGKNAGKRQLMMGLRLGEPRRKVAAGAGFSDFWRLVWAQPAVYLGQPLAVWAVTTLFPGFRPMRRIRCFAKAFYKKIEEHI